MSIFLCFMLNARQCSVIYLYENDILPDIGMRHVCVHSPATDISPLVSLAPQA